MSEHTPLGRSATSRPDVPMGVRLREIAHSLDTDKGPVLVKDNQLRDLLRALAEEVDS